MCKNVTTAISPFQRGPQFEIAFGPENENLRLPISILSKQLCSKTNDKLIKVTLKTHFSFQVLVCQKLERNWAA